MATYWYAYTAGAATANTSGIGVFGSDGTSFRYLRTDGLGAVYVLPSGTFWVSASALVSGNIGVTGGALVISAMPAVCATASALCYQSTLPWAVSGNVGVTGGALAISAMPAVSATASALCYQSTLPWAVSGNVGITGGALAISALPAISATASALCYQSTLPWAVSGNVGVTGGALAISAMPAVSATAQTYRMNTLITAAHDYITQTTAASTDTWVFKTGGAGGSTVGTITITYETTAKSVITTVVKT